MRGGEVRAGRREGLCGVVAARQEACTWMWPDSRLGAKGTRGAHLEHEAHGRDAGGVKAQRLVEGRRELPSRRGGHAMRGGRGASWEAGGPGVCGGGTTSGMYGEMARLKAGGQGHARSAPRT